MSCIDATAEVQAVALSYIWQGLFSMTFGSGLAVAGGHYVATTTDKPVFRRIVLAATILEILHVLMAVTDTARTFGAHYGSADAVYALSPFYVANMVIGAVLACLVQSFYAWRVYRLLGKRLVLLFGLGLLITFAFVSMIVAQMVAYNSADPGLFMSGAQTTEAFLYMRLPYIAAIAIDLCICGLTLLALHRARAMGHAQGVGQIVKRLVVLTITSNGLTTTYCIILLATSLRATEAFWALTSPVCDYYMLTLLVWLYGRRSNEGYQSQGSGPSGSGSSSGNSDSNKSGSSISTSTPTKGRARSQFGQISPAMDYSNGIHISTVREIHGDSESERQTYTDKDEDFDTADLSYNSNKQLA